MRCSRCQSDVPAAARFCPSCAAPIVVGRTVSEAATIDPFAAAPSDSSVPDRRPQNPPSSGTFNSSSSFASLHGRFHPGQVLASRYRIVGLLGRGGMGEVYRADDLTLGTAVALKFLPASLASDPVRVQRFLAEVRTTRQISHPAVCRVYDVIQIPDPGVGGAIPGVPAVPTNAGPQTILAMSQAAAPAAPGAPTLLCISMEYVDGEDLGSLLRRIGRLPHDKAVEIARQVCAGLAAAHDLGIVHRDLKPANIMLDGRGKARVMDFGVAGIADALNASGDITAGTPAYMAPEQLAGRGVSVRSDLYALGLVLYELFTGKPTWASKATNITELRRLHETSQPDAPSSFVPDLDPLVERVILRCLEADPAMRPASAIAVAAALPGGDPLAAALAAGETPSPEMVAASGSIGAIRPRAAVALLTTLLVSLGVAIFMGSRASFMSLIAPTLPPAALESKARDVMVAAGYTIAGLPSASGFVYDTDALRAVRDAHLGRTGEVDWRPALADPEFPGLQFFHRVSPGWLRPTAAWRSMVVPDDPPQITAGSARVFVDGQGRLTRFEAVPQRQALVPEMPAPAAGASEAPAADAAVAATSEPATDAPIQDASAPAAPAAVDWSRFFALAGLDPASFTAVASGWTPLSAADDRRAWTGSLATDPPTPVRIEAASEAGTPVFFAVIYPWTEPARVPLAGRGNDESRLNEALNVIFFLSAVIGGGFLCLRNIRAGRYDRRGATVVALATILLEWTRLVAGSPSLGAALSPRVLVEPAARALWMGGLIWMCYTALEPIVRRVWPNLLVGWTRLTAGRWRDPLVGREVFVGAVVGVIFVMGSVLVPDFQRLMGERVTVPELSAPDFLLAPNGTLATLLGGLAGSITLPMLLILLLVGLRALTRRNWAAFVLLGVLVAVINLIASSEDGIAAKAISLVGALIITVMATRAGLVAFIAMLFVVNTLGVAPLGIDLQRWHAPQMVVSVVIVLLIGLYGFLTSLGNQRVLRPDPAFS
jgi:hypothetical protein